MDMQTKSVDETGLPVQNFAVIALQRRVFSRSNIRFIFVNKQSLNYERPKDSTLPTYSDYNRNIGVEYNLASSNNMWTGKAMLLKSFSPGRSDKDFVFADSLQYLSIASAHGVVMVFFMIMPLLFGAFANFLLPTQLGVHDVAFPRLNSAAF